MVEASLQQVTGHVVLSQMDVDVCQEQPALLKLIGINKAPVHLSDAFELVPGSGSLFQHHVSCRHGQECRYVVALKATEDSWSDGTSPTMPLPLVHT